MGRRAEFSELSRMLGLWMLLIDPPEHSRLRKLINKGFSPTVMESLRPQIEAIVNRMLEPLRHVSEVDLIQEIAHPLPVRMIVEMLGVPSAMQDQLVQWSNAIATYDSMVASGTRRLLANASLRRGSVRVVG